MDNLTLILLVIAFLQGLILHAVNKLTTLSGPTSLDQGITPSEVDPSIVSLPAYLEDIIIQLRKIRFRLDHIAKDYDPYYDDEKIEQEQHEKE